MAENNRVSEILKDIVGELKDIANSQTVVGDPITVGDKTVIPVVKISVGFGAGGGQGETPDKGGGFGGGGGGGAKIEPSAFIIIDGDRIQLLSAKPGKLDALVEAVPGLFGKIKDIRDRMKKDKGEDKPAEEIKPDEKPPDPNPGY
ncbi:MAG: sporulation protein [candidate division Zixibacteria bacterium HGW-Zixibacteria-1]|nr:MAG: sporulation protein [candidate division Zixibacteria bacterium HGW-Zixibacteria-1]